jgi:Vacuolar protein 14 C-terminal Fig4p binding
VTRLSLCLVQMDRLVGLLETPAFTFLRLHLLQPAQHPALLQWVFPSTCGTSTFFRAVLLQSQSGVAVHTAIGQHCPCSVHGGSARLMQGVMCCRRAMYGLLQLLPQSDAFRTLHARLHAAPTAALLQLSPPPGGAGNGAPEKSPAEVTAPPWPATVPCSWW